MATIVEELRKLIEAKGGSATGVMTIAQAVGKLVELEEESTSGQT